VCVLTVDVDRGAVVASLQVEAARKRTVHSMVWVCACVLHTFVCLGVCVVSVRAEAGGIKEVHTNLCNTHKVVSVRAEAGGIKEVHTTLQR
jgi:hypothetical protein